MSAPWYDGIELGYSECETCGGASEVVEVSRNEDGTYDVNVWVGCYSGAAEYDTTASRAIDILWQWTHLDPGVQGLIERIKSDLQK